MSDFAATVKQIIDNIDPSDKELESIKEQLNSLQELADSKAEVFYNRIKLAHQNVGVGTDKTLPVESTGEIRKITKAYTSSTSELSIYKNVEESLSNLFGSIEPNDSDWKEITGASLRLVIRLMGDAIKAFLAESDGEEATDERSIVLIDGKMNLIRVDYGIWHQSINTYIF